MPGWVGPHNGFLNKPTEINTRLALSWHIATGKRTALRSAAARADQWCYRAFPPPPPQPSSLSLFPPPAARWQARRPRCRREQWENRGVTDPGTVIHDLAKPRPGEMSSEVGGRIPQAWPSRLGHQCSWHTRHYTRQAQRFALSVSRV